MGFWEILGHDIDGTAVGMRTGQSLSFSDDGTRVVVANPYTVSETTDRGYIAVYDLSGDDWEQIGTDIYVEELVAYTCSANGDWSVSLSSDGDTLAVGIPNKDNGCVKVYDLSGGIWTPIGSDLFGNNLDDKFGRCVSLNNDGTRLSAGAANRDKYQEAGYVKVYDLTDGIWVQKGLDISGSLQTSTPGTDGFGYSLSLSKDGTTLAVGAPWKANVRDDTSVVIDVGFVSVYDLSGDDWEQIGDDIIFAGPQNSTQGEYFGKSVSLSYDGSTLAVGATHEGYSPGSGPTGQVNFYTYSNIGWISVGTPIYGDTNGSKLGWSVSLSNDGTRVAVGGPDSSPSTIKTETGVVQIYDLSGSNWVQNGYNIFGERAWDDNGMCVVLSGNGERVAIGAPNSLANNDPLHSNDTYNIVEHATTAAKGYVRVLQNNPIGDEILLTLNYPNTEYSFPHGDSFPEENDSSYTNIVNGMTADDIVVKYDLNEGERFTFAGIKYYSVYISTNGWIQFDSDMAWRLDTQPTPEQGKEIFQLYPGIAIPCYDTNYTHDAANAPNAGIFVKEHSNTLCIYYNGYLYGSYTSRFKCKVTLFLDSHSTKPGDIELAFGDEVTFAGIFGLSYGIYPLHNSLVGKTNYSSVDSFSNKVNVHHLVHDIDAYGDPDLRNKKISFKKLHPVPEDLNYSNMNENDYATNNNNIPQNSLSYTTYTISPQLPSTLILDTNTGIISGTLSPEQSDTTYTVTATTTNGSKNVTFQILSLLTDNKNKAAAAAVTALEGKNTSAEKHTALVDLLTQQTFINVEVHEVNIRKERVRSAVEQVTNDVESVSIDLSVSDNIISTIGDGTMYSLNDLQEALSNTSLNEMRIINPNIKNAGKISTTVPNADHLAWCPMRDQEMWEITYEETTWLIIKDEGLYDVVLDPEGEGTYLYENQPASATPVPLEKSNGEKGGDLVFGTGFIGNSGTTNGASGDPFITTLSGITYKMADFTGYSRMLQGTLENKLFTLNTETTLLNKEELTELIIQRNQCLNKEIVQKNSFDKFPAYFSKIYASWGDESVTIDLKDFKVIQATQNKEYEYKTDMDKEYTWSTNKIGQEKMLIPFGPVTLVIKNIPNPDVRNGFTLIGSNHIIDKVGGLVKPMYVKDIKLKKLESIKSINNKIERKPKKFTKQTFITSQGNIDERIIPIY